MKTSSTAAARPLGLVCRISIAATLLLGWILLPGGQAQSQGSWEGPYTWPYVIAASAGPKEISHAAMIPTGLHAGKVLLFSWRRGSLPTDTFWLFDPSNPTDLIEFNQLLNSNIFCSGTSFDSSGRLVVAGGQGPATPADAYRLDFQKLGPITHPQPPATGPGSVSYSPNDPPWETNIDQMVLGRFYPTLLALLKPAIESFNPNIPTVPAGGSHLVLGGPVDPDCLVADGHEALEILPHGAMAWREPYWPAQNAFHSLPAQLEREIYELVPAPPDPNAPEVRIDSYPRGFVCESGDIFITGDVDTLRSGIAPPAASWVFRLGSAQAPPELITANFNEERHYGTAVILHMRPEHGNVDRILVFGGSRDKNWPSSPGGPGSNCYTGDPLTEGEVLQSVFELDNGSAAALEARTWRQKADMAEERMFQNAVVLPNGLILLVGGTKADYSRPSLFLTASCPVEANMNFAPELYDPGHNPIVTGSTTLLAASPAIPPYDLPIPRLYHHLALLLQDGRVLVVGGWQPPTVVPQGTPCENLIPAYPSAEDSGEIFSPPYLDLPYRPTFLRVPPNQVELSEGTNSKQFSCDVEIDPENVVVAVTLVRPAAVTHHFDNDQRFIELAFSVTTNPDGSKKVTATSPDVMLAPPGFYMVHVLEAPSTSSPRQDWSPSNGQFVQFH